MNNLDIDGTNTIHINLDGMGDGNILCALNVKLGQYEPKTCKAALGLLMTAQATGKRIRLWINNDTNTACFKGNWVNLANSGVYHLRIED